MTNHPNRDWQSRWTADLEASTASHRNGWIFAFSPPDDGPTAIDGRCIATPDTSTAQVARAERIARKAAAANILSAMIRQG